MQKEEIIKIVKEKTTLSEEEITDICELCSWSVPCIEEQLNIKIVQEPAPSSRYDMDM